MTRRGHIETRWESKTQQLITRYIHQNFRRALAVRLVRNTSTAAYGNGRINFTIDLPPNGTWHTCCLYDLVESKGVRRASPQCASAHDTSDVEQRLRQWKEMTTQLTTSNEDWYRLFRQSVEDMAALRLPYEGKSGELFLPAAGVPWFVSIFGRDSLIVSLQNMIVYPDFARGTLTRLAQLQATDIDTYRDAEPGKIGMNCGVGNSPTFIASRIRRITEPRTRPFSISFSCTTRGSGQETIAFSWILTRC